MESNCYIILNIEDIQDKNSKFELSQMHELHKQSNFYISRRNATSLVVGDHLYEVNRYNLTKRRVISKTIIFFDNWRRLIVDNCVNPVLIILPLSRSRLILPFSLWIIKKPTKYHYFIYYFN